MAFPLYIILALGAIGLVIWFSLRPIRNFTDDPPPLDSKPRDDT
jgi:hypothetical protein